MRVLVACECSGVVRRAFRERGHNAWSCDVKPVEDGSENHLLGDVLGYLDRGWDILVAHPPCDYLTNSAAWAYKEGPYHQMVKAGTLVGTRRCAVVVVRLGWRLFPFSWPYGAVPLSGCALRTQ